MNRRNSCRRPSIQRYPAMDEGTIANLGLVIVLLGSGVAVFGFWEQMPILLALSPFMIGGGFLMARRKRAEQDEQIQLPLKMRPPGRREQPAEEEPETQHREQQRGRG